MQGKIGAAFIAGVLSCALFIGALFGAFYALNNDAQAQSEQTWQVTRLNGLGADRFSEWIVEVPVQCDVDAIPSYNANGGFSDILVYYRC